MEIIDLSYAELHDQPNDGIPERGLMSYYWDADYAVCQFNSDTATRVLHHPIEAHLPHHPDGSLDVERLRTAYFADGLAFLHSQGLWR